MKKKEVLDILLFLTRLKEDKVTYLKYEHEIDRCSAFIKQEIEKPKGKFDFATLKEIGPTIIKLFFEYFNSS